VITPSEGTSGVITSYLASFFSSKPWTAVFQPREDLLQPSIFLGIVNPYSVLKHVNSKPSTKRMPFLSKLGLSINLFVLLKLAERTIVSTVSESVVEDFNYINPRIKFCVIKPGNGIELKELPPLNAEIKNYDCVFFARLISKKGIFDLPEIWKLVVKRIPCAVLLVCGIIEKQGPVNRLLNTFNNEKLSENVKFLGTQEKHELYDIISNSRLTIYPSYVDSFSLVTLESLGCGTPVVSYEIPAIRHNFGECTAVFMCPLGDKVAMADKIVEVLTKMERKPIAIVAKEFSTRFSWNAVIIAEKKVYLKIVESMNNHVL
jgi:glycosyltransferase involved in cell wall biosynthesis